MLTAYLDETGQSEKGLVFVGGFVGDRKSWDKCAVNWKEGFPPSQRQSLHMVRIDFEKIRDKELLERLGPIPEECGLKRVWGSVNVSDYFDLVEGTIGELHAHGYCLALVPLIISIRDKVANGERFELIFEEQTALGFYRDKMLEMIASTFPPHPHYQPRKGRQQKIQLAGWSSKPKGSICLFEPADYLCYHLAHRETEPDSVRTKWSQPIMGTGATFSDHLSQETARNLFGYLKNGPLTFTNQGPDELKAFKQAIRRGEIEDPWEELLLRQWERRRAK